MESNAENLYDRAIELLGVGEYAEAVRLLMLAAERGNADAQCYLGWCYENGHCVPRNYDKAAILYLKAAEQGYAPAQYNLGVCYEYGYGVLQSDGEAVK